MKDKIDTYNAVLDNIISLYKGYSNELRGNTQPFYYAKFKEQFTDEKYEPKNPLYRETLLEHVGSLPVIASTIYPHINDLEVDLGKTLVLLSIHDIGELTTGDEITFIKNKNLVKNEQAEALKLLDPFYHDLYNEVEARKSKSAQFAKSIDKITPDILDLITPAEITIVRYSELMNKKPQEIVPLIKEFKHPYMLWNDFMTGFHLVVLDRINIKLKPYY